MQKIWAPWRISYIKTTGKKQSACLFCQSLKSKKNSYIFIRNKFCFALLNKFPYNNGHIMISPNRHVADINSLRDKELGELFKTLKQVIRLLKKVLKPQGFNVGINIGKSSGAGIPKHLHIHVVPRWDADTNFMPVLFNTKVISQSLKTLHKELAKLV
ncbi:MAG: HIT domain-containing protein [Candidatus Omnitrophica bacterium]|nr:HIT domain-containing protein [Candidatus Omnitrophota bacterium]